MLRASFAVHRWVCATVASANPTFRKGGSTVKRSHRNEVAIKPFHTPDWVQSQEDFEKAVSVHVAEQIDRGVSKENIGKYLVESGLIDPEKVDSYYQSVLDVVKERQPEIRRQILKELAGWAFLLTAIGVIGAIVLQGVILPDIRSGVFFSSLLRVNYVFLAFMGVGTVALAVAVITGICTIISGLRRLVHHSRLGKRLDCS